MAFGETLQDAMFDRLSPWIKNPPDYDDVNTAYKLRGRLSAERAKLNRAIERAEDDVIMDSDKPRSNEVRIRKLLATKELRDQLAELDAQIAINDSEVKLLEYRRDMYKSTNYQLKNTMDL